MSPRRDVPPEWQEAFDAAGITSFRDLARRIDVSASTVTRLVFGEGISQETVEAAAHTLRLSVSRVWELHGTPRPNPFYLDPEADALSGTQRAAVRAVIAGMLEDKKKPAERQLHAVARRRRPPEPDQPIR